MLHTSTSASYDAPPFRLTVDIGSPRLRFLLALVQANCDGDSEKDKHKNSPCGMTIAATYLEGTQE